MELKIYGLYIKIIRSDLGISSKDLAKQFNYSAPNLSRIEKGQQECTQETFMAAVDVFSKTDPHYIFNSSKQLKVEALQTLKSFLRNYMSGFQAEGLREICSFITPAARLHSYAYFEVRLLNLIQDYFQEKDISAIHDIHGWIETYDCSFLPEEFVFIVYELSGLDAMNRRVLEHPKNSLRKHRLLGDTFSILAIELLPSSIQSRFSKVKWSMLALCFCLMNARLVLPRWVLFAGEYSSIF